MLALTIVPTSKTTGIPGWITDAEEALLVQLAQEYVNVGVVVGLGVEYGRSTAALYHARPEALGHYAVDIFPMNHHYAKDHGGLFSVFQHNLKLDGIDTDYEPEYGSLEDAITDDISSLPGVMAIRGKSAPTGRTWEGDPVDLIFIDAGHGFGQVKADIEAWERHISPGGVMVFHDYWRNETHHYMCKDVKRAVDEWHEMARWERHNGPDTVIYFVKPLSQKIDEPEEVFEVFVADDPIVDMDEEESERHILGIALYEDDPAERAPDEDIAAAGSGQTFDTMEELLDDLVADELMTVKELAAHFYYKVAYVRQTIKKIESKGKRGASKVYSKNDFAAQVNLK